MHVLKQRNDKMKKNNMQNTKDSSTAERIVTKRNEFICVATNYIFCFLLNVKLATYLMSSIQLNRPATMRKKKKHSGSKHGKLAYFHTNREIYFNSEAKNGA